MNPETLLDAMQHLPDELLEQTDRLRQSRSVPWQRWATMAACLCLVLGIAYAFLLPGAKSQDGAGTNGQAQEEMDIGDVTQSSKAEYLLATVTEVKADCLTVKMATGEQVTVLLTELESIPALEPGMQIHMFLKGGFATQDRVIAPYRIEIKEERP